MYSVDEFVNEHPGGADKIEPYFGQDIEQVFEDTGHSDYAKSLFTSIPIVGYYSKLMVEKMKVEHDRLYM